MNKHTSEAEMLNLPRLIAITGQEGSGKDSVGNYLAAHGYMHVSAGDVLRERARAQGRTDPIPRTILSQVGDEMKKQFGPSPITASTLAKYGELREQYPAGVVISGLRRVGELKAFKTQGAVALWITADIDRRYANQSNRARADQQGRASFIEKSNEEYYGKTQGGEDGVNLQAIESLADNSIVNDGSLEDLYHNAAEALRLPIK